MIDYTYELTEVIEEQNQMMVKFSSPGREDIIVGTPLPTEGIDLKDFLYPYAPIPIWLENDRKVFVPEVGATGQYSVQEYEEKRREKEMAALMEYNNSLEQQLMRELQIQSTKDLVTEVLVEKGLITPE
jgi:hypothetical protein